MAVSGRLLPIFVSLVGVCLIGLLIYGISHQAASRTLDEAVPTASIRSRPSRPLAAGARPALARLARVVHGQGGRVELLGLLV